MVVDIARYERLGHIRTHRHPEFPLTVCKYTRQFQNRNLWDKVMLSMRGSVYDESGTCVSQPLNKFFNYGEKPTPAGSYVVQEKLDGTCIVVFRWQGHPVVHTLGSFTSPQAKAAQDFIAVTYGWEWLPEGGTFVFEWMDPDNFTTLRYVGEKMLVLLAWLIDGHEIALTPTCWSGPVARTLDHDEIEFLLRRVPDDEEGYVLIFDDWRLGQRQRMKIKGERYLALSRAKWGLNDKVVWEYTFERAVEEIVAFIHNLDEEAQMWFVDTMNRLSDEAFALRDRAEEAFAKIVADEPDVRTAAGRIKELDQVLQPWCFARMNGKELPHDYFARCVKPKGLLSFAAQDAA